MIISIHMQHAQLVARCTRTKHNICFSEAHRAKPELFCHCAPARTSGRGEPLRPFALFAYVHGPFEKIDELLPLAAQCVCTLGFACGLCAFSQLSSCVLVMMSTRPCSHDAWPYGDVDDIIISSLVSADDVVFTPHLRVSFGGVRKRHFGSLDSALFDSAFWRLLAAAPVSSIRPRNGDLSRAHTTPIGARILRP
ncbi:hypothetical protein BC834DRAFT_42139 [Gloeopeniophorella convolvens]|nr:hypothetical protein BC834DRAFT_42139 [Gloeopeniophorella convolvens]